MIDDAFEGLPPCPPGPNSHPSSQQYSQPQQHRVNYYLALLDGLFHSFADAANRLQCMGKFDQAMYYRGKADATREAIQHYRELMP